jgi:WD40 repeat protein
VLNQERYTEHNAPILQCVANPSGSYIASVDTDSVLKVWCTSPLIKTKLTRVEQALPARITTLAWDFQSDTTLYIGFENGEILGIDVETEAETGAVKMPDTHPRVVALASQGSMVVCGLSSGADRPTGLLMLLHSKTLTTEAQLPVQSKSSVPCSFNFNHNTTLLVVGCEDGMVQIFDVRSNKFIMGWQAHKHRICGTKFSQDETTVFSSSTDGKLMRWNAHHLGAPIAQSPAEAIALPYAATYPHASDFSFDVEDECVAVHFVDTASTCCFFVLYPDPPGLVFCRNRYVLRNCSGSDVSAPGEIGIFVLRHSASDSIAPPALKLLGHEAAVTCFTWSTTTNTIISGSADKTIRIYTLFKVT